MKKHKKKWNQPHSPLKQKIKYVGIRLPKETQELHTENCNTLMKEIKDNANRWRDISYSCVGRINIVKITMLLFKLSTDSK